MSKPEFVRRKSYFIKNKEDLKILDQGQHQITIYSMRGQYVGTYQTSIREVPRNHCLYLSGVNVPKYEDPNRYGEFYVGFRSYDSGPDFKIQIVSCGELYFNPDTGKMFDRWDNKKENEKFFHEYDCMYFHIEIIGGDYFQETNIKAIHTMLENKVIPNDLVRMLKPFLY